MNYRLTRKQQKVFAKLQKAFDDCKKAGIYIWDDYGQISGVNGEVISLVAVDELLDGRFDRDQASVVTGHFIEANSDDDLYYRAERVDNHTQNVIQ